jgi:hypothetical protein
MANPMVHYETERRTRLPEKASAVLSGATIDTNGRG